MQCATCARDLADQFTYCPYCGAERPSACGACGTSLGSDFSFCPRCGARRPSRRGLQALVPSVTTSPLTTPRTASAARSGERRVVTVIFADVVGFTKMSESFDPETLTDMMNRLFERFGAVVRRYEGTVDKFIGDAAMILFGAPVSHEDDAERAVLTARDMLALLPAVNEELARSHGTDPRIAIHVGIATGLVVAGSVGTGAGGGYTVMGDAVNLAARLVDLASPGQILIAESTNRLVRGRVRAQLVQTMNVKGKEEPVAVYRVIGADQSGADSRGLGEFYSPLVGRDSELARLRDAFQYLREGAGCILATQGPAGVGKSRVVRECLESLAEAGIAPRVHVGRCISYGRNVPYYPWSQIVAALLTDSDALPVTSAHRDLLMQVATGAFGNRPPAEAERHREAVFAAVAALLDASSASTPRILVLEDMHWADATSLDLLLALLPVSARAPIMLLVVFRPGVGEDLRERISSGPASVRAGSIFLEMAPLSRQATRALVENLTRDIVGFDDRLRDKITERSEGIPLFVEEILRHYVDEGILVRAGEGWRVDPARGGDASSVPTTLHALLSAKVDRLPAQEKARLELAGVIGKDFDPRLVDTLLGLTHDESVWKRLEDSGEIAPTAASGGYRFVHALTQEVVYATILRSTRQRLHLAVAEALERNRQSTDENLHSLAWHFEQAALPDKASAYWLRAAEQAVGVYANVEALDLFDKAMTAAPSASAAREALLGKAELLARMGRSEAVAAFDRLVDMAQAAGDLVAEATMLARRAYVAYQCGDGPGIASFAERALSCARASGNRAVIALALRQVGIGHEFAGRFGPAEAAYRELLAVDGDRVESPHTAAVYNSLGEMARASGRYQESITLYERAHASFLARNPGGINSAYLSNMGAAYVQLGQFHRAQSLLDQATTERRRTGYLSFLSETYYYRGLCNLGLGQVDEAARDAEEAYRLATQLGETEMTGLALRLLALVLETGPSVHLEGLPTDPEANLRASVQVFGSIGKRGEEARSCWELGRYLRRRGRIDEARPEFARARALFSQLGFGVLAADVGVDSEGLGGGANRS